MQDIDPRVKEMYLGVKEVLMKYRSGKLPKAFKIIPKLKNWEQILYITGIHNIQYRFEILKVFSEIICHIFTFQIHKVGALLPCTKAPGYSLRI